MKLFSKEPTVEFISLSPEVIKLAPIIPAHKFRPDILLNSGKDFATKKKQPDFGMSKLMSTAKCPGIFNMARYGYILTTWQDIVIETNGDGESFHWTTPSNQLDLTNGRMIGEMVGYHPQVQYTDYVGKRPDTLANVLKIHTPWRCIVPEGYYLHEGPVPYNNDHRFTTVEGVFSREHGVAQMNVQLLWHVMEGKTLIKAGTPIAHYMLLPKKQPELVVRTATDKEVQLDSITVLHGARTNIADIKENKCFFANLFKDM
jgi:hypothetical protein